MSTEAGRKDDTGKAPWDLAPWDAFLAIVKVLAFGARKYAPRNWEKGIAASRVYAAALRHLTDWWTRADKGKGPGKDADTGFSDLWHAGCCVCFLIAYELRGTAGTDDRPTLTLADTAEIMTAARVVTVAIERPRDISGFGDR